MHGRISRRGWMAASGAAALSLATARKALPQGDRTQLIVHADLETGTVRPELHGQFAEHLGSCVYGGLWVGRNSRIPNIDGHRKQAVEYLKAVGIPVLRWPGGCFADDYHWRDGIGPPAKRPRRVNIWWGKYTEDNSFGTHEFIGLCRLIGAQPYLAGNVGSGTPQELRDWVEYCNYPSGSSLSDERAANGDPQPFDVKYWGVGNENWGCGGAMHPQEYCQKYRQYANYLKDYGETKLFLVACGPGSNDLNWTREFFESLGPRRHPNGYSMHFYSRGKDEATHFTAEDMYEQFSSFHRMERAIEQQRGLMDAYDADRRIGLFVDEWGVWDRMVPEEEKRYGRLWQQITMRSAAAAALGLNVFHRQASRLYMCNIAQMVNVLHSLLLTDEDKCIRTSTYWVFDMMKRHRGQTAVQIEGGTPSPLGLSASASRSGNQLTLTLVNPGHETALDVDCRILGARPVSSQGLLLHHADLNACNTFSRPDEIVPKPHTVQVNGERLAVTLPPLSVSTLAVRTA